MLILSEVDLLKNVGISAIFAIFGILVLILAHLLFHKVVKKFSHGIDFDTEIKKGNLAAAIVYAVSELAFVGGVAAIIAVVAA